MSDIMDLTTSRVCSSTEYISLFNVSHIYIPIDIKRYEKRFKIRKLNELFGSATKCACPICSPDTGD